MNLEYEDKVDDNELSTLANESSQQVAKKLRKQGFWLIGWGIFNIIFPSFDTPFGVALVLLGISSIFFRSPAMFVVQGVFLSWAAVSNLFVGGFSAIFISLMLGIWAIQDFRRFGQYRYSGEVIGELSPDDDFAAASNLYSGRILPWAGCLLGAFSLLGFLAVLLAGMTWFVFNGDVDPPQITALLGGIMLQLGVVAFATGLASILSGYLPKVIGIMGLLLGVAGLGI